MIRSIIIDDEDKATKNLKSLLDEYCTDVEVMAMESNVNSGIEAINKHHPDLVFLDVRMQNETGFDLLEQVKNIDFDIIFVTANDKYAVKAFKFSAVDYILKPINIEELQEAVKKIHARKEDKESGLSYEILKENLNYKDARMKKIGIPTAEGLIFIRINDIVRCEADGSYTHVYLMDKNKITVSKILKEFDELLSDYNFYRVHQSHLVNMEHIKKYVSAKGGQVVMVDEACVGVSRNNKEGFLKKLSEI